MSQDGVRLNLGQDAGVVPVAEVAGAAPGKVLAPAARRALEEAAARRAAATRDERPPEDGGPAGPEPTRFGDWERKGIAVDF
ncbi:MAG: DUF1674 domain-containing protein [Caulobacter sp.]|nr:DUF1674 domain-containing protein [Caulobacter sp.]